MDEKMYDDGLVYRDWGNKRNQYLDGRRKERECGMFLDVLDNSRRIWDYLVTENIPSATGEGVASMKLIGGIAAEEGGEPHTLATSGASGCLLITKAGAKTEQDVEKLPYLSG